jgi:hypothetical protein
VDCINRAARRFYQAFGNMWEHLGTCGNIWEHVGTCGLRQKSVQDWFQIGTGLTDLRLDAIFYFYLEYG